MIYVTTISTILFFSLFVIFFILYLFEKNKKPNAINDDLLNQIFKSRINTTYKPSEARSILRKRIDKK